MTTGDFGPNDFAQILADFTRTLSYKVVNKTTDPLTGDETTTFAGATNVSAVFFNNDVKWIMDKSGLIEVGDAYILVPATTTIKRYDQFTIDGETYYIEKVINRYVLQTHTLNYGVCFKVA